MKEGSIDSLVIGVGINIGQQEFPGEISEMAASLQQESSKPVDREKLIERVMVSFEECYESFLQSTDLFLLRQEYNDRLVNRGKRVRVMGAQEEWTGEALGINAAGELLVRRKEGNIERVFAGEVSVRGIYGYV